MGKLDIEALYKDLEKEIAFTDYDSPDYTDRQWARLVRSLHNQIGLYFTLSRLYDIKENDESLYS